MPVLIWLNENTGLRGRIVNPVKTSSGAHCFDDGENVYLLFDFIEGETVGKTLTHKQLLEAADILAGLHSAGSVVPIRPEPIREDFSVPFSDSLDHFIAEDYPASPADIKAVLQPCLEQLLLKSTELKSLSEKARQKKAEMVFCHTDAHGWNLIMAEHLVLVDWEGLKLAPAEADFVMFTKRDYWEIFIGHYQKLRPEFIMDHDLLSFYILRRKIEDIWAFIEGILLDNPCDEQRKRDLNFLSNCCNTLEDSFFEL